MKILLVEDEAPIREVQKLYLEKEGYSIVEASNGNEAVKIFEDSNPDLVVLDLNLPEKDGIEVCKEIRSIANTPIVMVTARVEEIDELLGLEVGADDYVKKPFSPSVLVARVQALLRRIGERRIEIDDIIIDPELMRVEKGDDRIELTTTQFNVLYTLAMRPGKVFTRDEILDKAYDEVLPKDVLDRTVDAHIKAIRKKIEPDTKNPKYILTVIGKGYKFNDDLKSS